MSESSRGGSSEGQTRAMKWYRMSLRMWPRESLRHRAAMEETFEIAMQEAERQGGRAAAELLTRELVDVVRTGASLRINRAVGRSKDREITMGGHGPRRYARALRDDLTCALRAINRQRGFFLFAACTLAIGVGASTAIFSTMKSVLYDPLPFPAGNRIVGVWSTVGVTNKMLLPPTADELTALRSQKDIFEVVAPFGSAPLVLTGTGEPQKLNSVQLNPELVQIMGVKPIIGRLFTDRELVTGDASLAVVSFNLWKRLFGGGEAVLGKTISLSGKLRTIIGVMQPGAVNPSGSVDPVDLWVPAPQGDHRMSVIARLRPGVTMQSAEARVTQVMRSIAGDAASGSVSQGAMQRQGSLRDPLRLLMVAVVLVLMIACVNISNLLLQRSSARQHEASIRMAIGAARGRLARQLLIESLLLGLAGCVLGVALAWGAVHVMIATRPEELKSLQIVKLDIPVLAFSLLISVCASVLFGVMPALNGTRVQAIAALGRAPRSGKDGAASFKWTLIGTEVALAFAILVTAVLVGTTLSSEMRKDSGYSPDSFVDLNVSLPPWRYSNESARREMFQRIMSNIQQIKGVESVALATAAPPSYGVTFGKLTVDGRASNGGVFLGGEVDDHYLDAIGARVVEGRGFTREDMAKTSDAVVLGQTTARRIFARGSAVGRHFKLDDASFTVVGIVKDDGDDEDLAYWPLKDVYAGSHVIVHTKRTDATFLHSLLGIVRSNEPQALINHAGSGSDLLRDSVAQERFTMSLLAGFAATALLLAGIGLYGVLSRVVTSRRHEIGIRVSLGADSMKIRMMVMRTGTLVTIAGVAVGTALAYGGSKLLSSSIFGVSTQRPGAYISAAALIGLIATAAMWIPSYRASRVNPMEAFRD